MNSRIYPSEEWLLVINQNDVLTTKHINHVKGGTNQNNKEFLLQFSYKSNGDDNPKYKTIFQKYCKTNKLINVRSLGRDDKLELSFYVSLKKDSKSNNIVKALKNIPEIDSVNLFYSENTL